MFLVKRSCPVNLWNQAKENSKGKDRMSVELNHYLEITRSRIHQIYRELEIRQGRYHSRSYEKAILWCG